LEITVSKAGTVTVSINKNGIETGSKTVTVHKEGEATPLTYTVTADGTSGTVSSTTLTFVFSEEVSDLSASDITLADGSGSASKGDLTKSGQNWSLAITVSKAGTVTVSINKTGIDSDPQTVTVHKAGETPTPQTTTYTAEANGTAGTETSTAITFTFSGEISGLTVADITVTDGTGSASKGELTGSGQTWSLAITVAMAGDVAVSINKTGIESGDKTVAVHKVEVVPPPDTEKLAITIGFNYGAITINGSNGANIIYKAGTRSPNSLALSAAGYTEVNWYVDGSNSPAGTGNSITLNASNYSAKAHTITFTGKRDGNVYSQDITFTVKN
jgi:hypothetical protein